MKISGGSGLSWLGKGTGVAVIAYGGGLRSTGCMNLIKYRVSN